MRNPSLTQRILRIVLLLQLQLIQRGIRAPVPAVVANEKSICRKHIHDAIEWQGRECDLISALEPSLIDCASVQPRQLVILEVFPSNHCQSQQKI